MGGHYVTTLYRNGQWIDCNDEVVTTTNEAPKMGYLFFYDKVSDAPLALPGLPIRIPEEDTLIIADGPASDENYSNQTEGMADQNNIDLQPRFSSDSTNQSQQ